MQSILRMVLNHRGEGKPGGGLIARMVSSEPFSFLPDRVNGADQIRD